MRKYLYPDKSDNENELYAIEHLHFYLPRDGGCKLDEDFKNGETLKDCGYGDDIPANCIWVLWRNV